MTISGNFRSVALALTERDRSLLDKRDSEVWVLEGFDTGLNMSFEIMFVAPSHREVAMASCEIGTNKVVICSPVGRDERQLLASARKGDLFTACIEIDDRMQTRLQLQPRPRRDNSCG